MADESNVAPWDRSPSRLPPRPQIAQPLPKSIRTVLAQRLYVEKAGLPSPLLNQIKRLAAFQNPEFFKRGSAPRLVEKERGASSDVIAPRIGFHRSPYSHDLEVA
jgi:hypothetical protein